MVNQHEQSPALVLDWDGTVTELDTLHMVNDRFGDPELFGALEDGLGRSLTLDEVIAQEIATVTAPVGEVVAYLLDHVRVRAGFAELVEAYDPLIVSAGFHELIDPILARERVEARVEANNVVADPAGWRATFRDRGASPAARSQSGSTSRGSSTSRSTTCGTSRRRSRPSPCERKEPATVEGDDRRRRPQHREDSAAARGAESII